MITHPLPWMAQIRQFDEGRAYVLDANGGVVVVYRDFYPALIPITYLFAAAPELLDAVKELLDDAKHIVACEGHYFSDKTIARYEALIAKATGGNHEL